MTNLLLLVPTICIFLQNLPPIVSPVSLSKVKDSKVNELQEENIETNGENVAEINTEQTENESAVIIRIENSKIASDEYDESVMMVEIDDVEGDNDQRNGNSERLNKLEDSNNEPIKVLDEIWEVDGIDTKTNKFKSKNIFDKQPKDEYEVSSSKINSSTENKLELYLTHVIIMIVFIMFCLVVVMKMVRRTSRPTSNSVSQV